MFLYISITISIIFGFQESEDGFPLGSGSTLSKVYELKPLLSNNKDKWGLGECVCYADDIFIISSLAIN